MEIDKPYQDETIDESLHNVEAELHRALEGRGYRVEELLQYLPQNKGLMSTMIDLVTNMLFKQGSLVAVPSDSGYFFFMKGETSIPRGALVVENEKK